MLRKAISILLVLLFLPTSAPSLSVEKEKEIGRKLFKELRERLSFVDDPVISSYVEGVGAKVVKASGDRRFEYRFYVIEEGQPNAFTIPGGYVFVNSGLLQMVESEDELAGVLAHEVAHSVLRHISKLFERAQRVSIATLAILVAGALLAKGSKAKEAIGASAAAMAQSLMLKYSRENEMEADQLGAKLMERAGYHPWAFVSFLKKIYRWGRSVSPEVPSYLSTHPGVADRIAYLSAQFKIGEGPGASTALRRVKARLSVCERGPEVVLAELWRPSDEKDVDLLYTMGFALLKASRPQEAIAPLEDAHELAPSDPYIGRELGLAHYRCRHFRRAEGFLQEAFRAFPADQEVAFALGHLLTEGGRLEEALKVYKALAGRRPELPEVYRSMGELYMDQGRRGLAHEHFGIYFSKIGDKKAAIFHLKKALELSQGEDKERIQQRLRRLTGS